MGLRFTTLQLTCSFLVVASLVSCSKGGDAKDPVPIKESPEVVMAPAPMVPAPMPPNFNPDQAKKKVDEGVSLLKQSKKVLEEAIVRLEKTRKVLKANFDKAVKVIQKNIKQFNDTNPVVSRLKEQIPKLKKQLDEQLKHNDLMIKKMKKQIADIEAKIKSWVSPAAPGASGMGSAMQPLPPVLPAPKLIR